MTRMILNTRQLMDQIGHARQRPEDGLVTMLGGTCQQRLGDLIGLLRRELGFRARRTLAGQRGTAALLPRLLPAVGHLPGHPQPTSDFSRRMILGKEFGCLLPALFHRGMVSCLAHAPTLPTNQSNVTLLCETQ